MFFIVRLMLLVLALSISVPALDKTFFLKKIPLARFGLGLATVFSNNLASYSKHLKLLVLGRSALKLAA